MGVPRTEDGGQMSVTGQVEIAGGELVWEQVSRMRETADEVVGTHGTRSPTGQFSRSCAQVQP